MKKRKKRTPEEQIIAKLRDADATLNTEKCIEAFLKLLKVYEAESRSIDRVCLISWYLVITTLLLLVSLWF